MKTWEKVLIALGLIGAGYAIHHYVVERWVEEKPELKASVKFE